MVAALPYLRPLPIRVHRVWRVRSSERMAVVAHTLLEACAQCTPTAQCVSSSVMTVVLAASKSLGRPAPMRMRSSICCADTTTIDDHRIPRPSTVIVIRCGCAHRRSSTCVSTTIAAPRPRLSMFDHLYRSFLWGTFTTSMEQRKSNQRVYKLVFVLIHRVNTQTHHVNTSQQHYYFIVSVILSNETVLRHHCIYITHAHANL